MDQRTSPPGRSAQRHGTIQVIARAGRILRAVENASDGLSLGEIAREVGLARSTVQRIVAALVAEDLLIAATPNARVKLGPMILRLAAATDIDAAKLLRPLLQELSQAVQETVDVSVLRGGSAVFLDQIAGKRRLMAVSAVGDRFPLHCTANGKALLALMPLDERHATVARSVREHPGHPLANPAQFWREIEVVALDHIAFDRDEHTRGISAVGTALIDPWDRPLAISIPVPTVRFRRNESELKKALLTFRQRVIKVLSR